MYVDDSIQFSVLTPKILIHGLPITAPEDQFDDDDKVIKKQQQTIKHFNYAVWNRWNKEYLRSLRERNNMENNQEHMEVTVGDVVLTKGDDVRDRQYWR